MAQTASDEWDEAPTVDEVGRALDRRILEQTTKGMPPLARIAFEGAMGTADIQRIREQIGQIEIIAPHSRSPVEFMCSHPKDKLAEWEKLACDRFRLDFDTAHRSSSMTVNYDALAAHATDRTRAHQRHGYSGRSAMRMPRMHDTSTARISAMQRRGAFAARHPLSFWLAEAIIGWELWPKDIAPYLEEDARTIGRLFRVAIADLAGFYRLHATGPRHNRTQVYHSDGA